MRRMGIEAIYRRPRTSIPAREAAIYPYLLRGLSIERPNQVWASDITYLPMAHGFLYLVAILDVASRKVLSLSALEHADGGLLRRGAGGGDGEVRKPGDLQHRPGLAVHQRGVDQGARRTPASPISMDGKGRWIDNVFIERLWRSVKYEEVYLHAVRERHRGATAA